MNYHSICHIGHSLHGEWPQWSLLLELISSEPDEIPLVEKWIFTLLELESSEIHSSTSEISSLHGRSALFTRFFNIFFYREYHITSAIVPPPPPPRWCRACMILITNMIDMAVLKENGVRWLKYRHHFRLTMHNPISVRDILFGRWDRHLLV